MTRPAPHPLREAAIDYANLGIPILPSPLRPMPELAGAPPACTCHRRDCPAVPIHPPRQLHPGNPARSTGDIRRWWTATPDAAVATVAGAAFDVIEIHSAIPPTVILDWLANHALGRAAVLQVGLGRLQVLAAPDSYQTDRYDSHIAALLYLPADTLLLLPPSRLGDGQPITWLRPLEPAAELPDGKKLFWTLVELPANQQLADPDLYTFPATRQHTSTG